METRSSLQSLSVSGYLPLPLDRSVDTNTPAKDPSTPDVGGYVRDTVTLSQAGKEQSSQNLSAEPDSGQAEEKETGEAELNEQELQELQKLKSRDQEVRAHEQAHLSAAGQYARGGMSFTYQKGPDGVAYAIGGEVGVDLAKESTPEATLQKMQTIQRAALAPASPSGQDRQIAAQAAAKAAQARQEILRKSQEELKDVAETPEDRGSSETPAPAEVAGGQAKPSFVSLRSAIAAYKRIAEA